MKAVPPRRFYVETLTPIFDFHKVPKRIRPALIRFYCEVRPLTPALERFSRLRGWNRLFRECNIAANAGWLALRARCA
ncbi:hypothetical protein Pan44_35620 [Caulifigura coniformis]|uniref:Uncharacterized protein n=1 Tax=Caulifigura coniformis TaxID=2527983 RepID=A0A517SHA7_9PLAN|nr:hypothetical protein [Caulifigura coniformis]QDT55518.1 hypothetical protein Pan44_35620 [Caulifigura coniformis]